MKEKVTYWGLQTQYWSRLWPQSGHFNVIATDFHRGTCDLVPLRNPFFSGHALYISPKMIRMLHSWGDPFSLPKIFLREIRNYMVV